MILPMTRDTEDLADAAAEPRGGDAEHPSPREEPARPPADAGEGAADAPVSSAPAAPARNEGSRP